MVEEDRKVCRAALAGLYKRGAAGLVRDQIESHLVAAPLPEAERAGAAQSGVGSAFRDNNRKADHFVGTATHPYDVSAEGLVVWPYSHFESAVRYPLDDKPVSTPRPRSLARAAGLAPLPLSALVYKEHSLAWEDWRAYWDTEQKVSAIPIRLLPDVELLRDSVG